jgi:anti-sigma B factor antagonist
MNAATYRREGATVNLTLAINQLDAPASQQVKEKLRSLPLDGITRVVIELGTVEFIDSSGVGALLTLCKWLPPGAVVQLTGVQPEVRAVLELLRLHRVFEISA